MTGDTLIYETDIEKVKQYPNEDHNLKFTELRLDRLCAIDYIDILDNGMNFDDKIIAYGEEEGYALSKVNSDAIEYIFEKYPALSTLKSASALDEEDPLYQLENMIIDDLIKIYTFVKQHGADNLYAYATF